MYFCIVLAGSYWRVLFFKFFYDVGRFAERVYLDGTAKYRLVAIIYLFHINTIHYEQLNLLFP